MKVLVVEDNEDSRNLLVKQLRAYGHEVTAAADGAEALQQALAQPPDVIVSDIMMPNMDGYQLCHECKQNDKLRDIPFIFYTATYTSDEDEKFALSLGANTFIRKPTEPDVLVQMLSEVFEKAKSGLLPPPEVALLEPSLYLTEYNKRLVTKLDKKVAQLEAEITQRKQAEAALKESESKLSSILSSMVDLIFVLDKDSRFASFYVPSNELYVPPEKFVGERYSEVMPPHVNKLIAEAFDKNKKGEIAEFEYWLEIGDKTEWYYAKVSPIIVDGEFAGCVIVARNITERKQAEEALRQSEEKLRLMFESVAEGITITDLDGKIVEANEAVVRLHGYDSKEELIGQSSFELIARKDRARAMENLKMTLGGGYVKDIEYTFLTKDGTEFPAELSAAVLRDASGKTVGFIGITEDITERKRMEEQLIITDRLASVGELASGIAHELNNPLTGVIGFAQMVLDKDIPDDIKRDIEVVYSEAQRTAQVVKNLLTFARKHAPAKQLVSINSTIEKVLELRAYEQKVSNIQVNTQFAPDLDEVMVDYFQLQQVFLNIIINAEHFMIEAHNGGNLTITTERAGDIIKASFTDDGPGIAEENMGHLFDPFFTTKEVGKGTGLGLSICHGIVAEHGGRIYAKSKPGKGATFIVELPIGAH